jgi:hypothetical protein
MKGLAEAKDILVVWTQKRIPTTAPAPKCIITEEAFFQDPRATDDYLNDDASLTLNDSDLKINTEAVGTCLDLYLDILQLTDIWDILTLKIHIENCILRNATIFIRIENAQAVGEPVKRYNAKRVEKHWQEFANKNKVHVQLNN